MLRKNAGYCTALTRRDKVKGSLAFKTFLLSKERAISVFTLSELGDWLVFTPQLQSIRFLKDGHQVVLMRTATEPLRSLVALKGRLRYPRELCSDNSLQRMLPLLTTTKHGDSEVHGHKLVDFSFPRWVQNAGFSSAANSIQQSQPLLNWNGMH